MLFFPRILEKGWVERGLPKHSSYLDNGGYSSKGSQDTAGVNRRAMGNEVEYTAEYIIVA